MYSNSNGSHSVQKWEALKKQLDDELSKPPTSPKEELLWCQERAKWSEKMYAFAVELEEHQFFNEAIQAYYLSFRTTDLYAARRRLGFKAGFQDLLNRQSVYASKKEIEIEKEIEIKIDASAEDCFYAGLRYFAGLGVKQNKVTAFELLKRVAEQGHAEAQYNLSQMYEYGHGVEQDFKKAIDWYRKAAEKGHAAAQNNLGQMYEYGCGVAQDFKKAIDWYRKAAEQGHAAAQYNLGQMHECGRGVDRNDEEAVRWYLKAAEQGHAAAQCDLGGMYAMGRGVDRNDETAVCWFRKAAKQGFAEAQNNLGDMYVMGHGVPQNDGEAIQWYRKAAEQGYSKAKKILSLLYSGEQASQLPVTEQDSKLYWLDYKIGILKAENMLELCARQGHFEGRYYNARAKEDKVILTQLRSENAQKYYELLKAEQEANTIDEAYYTQELTLLVKKEGLETPTPIWLGEVLLDLARILRRELEQKKTDASTPSHFEEAYIEKIQTILNYLKKIPASSQVYLDALNERIEFCAVVQAPFESAYARCDLYDYLNSPSQGEQQRVTILDKYNLRLQGINFETRGLVEQFEALKAKIDAVTDLDSESNDDKKSIEALQNQADEILYNNETYPGWSTKYTALSRLSQDNWKLIELPHYKLFQKLKENLERLSYRSDNQDRMGKLQALREFANQIENVPEETWEVKYHNLNEAIQTCQAEVEEDHEENGTFSKIKKSSFYSGSGTAFFKIKTQSPLTTKLSELIKSHNEPHSASSKNTVSNK